MLAPLLPLRSPDPGQNFLPPGTIILEKGGGAFTERPLLAVGSTHLVLIFKGTGTHLRGEVSCLPLPAMPFTLLSNPSSSRWGSAIVYDSSPYLPHPLHPCCFTGAITGEGYFVL